MSNNSQVWETLTLKECQRTNNITVSYGHSDTLTKPCQEADPYDMAAELLENKLGIAEQGSVLVEGTYGLDADGTGICYSAMDVSFCPTGKVIDEESVREQQHVSESNVPVVLDMNDGSGLDREPDGYVYVLSNASIPDMYKIGFTTNHPTRRAKEISRSTGVPTPFVVEYSIKCDRPHEAEKMAHKALNSFRVNNKREFFNMSLSEAVATIREVSREYADIYKNPEFATKNCIEQYAEWANNDNLRKLANQTITATITVDNKPMSTNAKIGWFIFVLFMLQVVIDALS